MYVWYTIFNSPQMMHFLEHIRFNYIQNYIYIYCKCSCMILDTKDCLAQALIIIFPHPWVDWVHMGPFDINLTIKQWSWEDTCKHPCECLSFVTTCTSLQRIFMTVHQERMHPRQRTSKKYNRNDYLAESGSQLSVSKSATDYNQGIS